MGQTVFGAGGEVIGFIRAGGFRATSNSANALIFMPMRIVKAGTRDANDWFNDQPVVKHFRYRGRRMRDLKAPTELFRFRCTFGRN